MLVKNSEKYLRKILSSIAPIADEIILLDSGSSDQTREIATQWSAHWHTRDFDNFKNQRTYALSLCHYPMVLSLDDDEIPNDVLIANIAALKKIGFSADAYAISREWIVLGKYVHSMYPISSPDFPIRLFNQEKVRFTHSNQVHESCSGYSNKEILGGKILHHTFHDREELKRKLDFYTSIAAQDVLDRGKKARGLLLHGIFAWCKSYFVKSGWRDGKTGVLLANYAFSYTVLKYRKSKREAASNSPATTGW